MSSVGTGTKGKVTLSSLIGFSKVVVDVRRKARTRQLRRGVLPGGGDTGYGSGE